VRETLAGTTTVAQLVEDSSRDLTLEELASSLISRGVTPADVKVVLHKVELDTSGRVNVGQLGEILYPTAEFAAAADGSLMTASAALRRTITIR